MTAQTLSIANAMANQARALSEVLPKPLLAIGTAKLANANMSVADIVQWSNERSESGNEIANRIFSAPGSKVTWSDAKFMVKTVRENALVISADEMFVVQYDAPQDERERPTVTATRREDDYEIVREFSDMDLEADTLHDAGLLYLSAAHALRSPNGKPPGYSKSVIRHTDIERKIDANNNGVEHTMGEAGWL